MLSIIPKISQDQQRTSIQTESHIILEATMENMVKLMSQMSEDIKFRQREAESAAGDETKRDHIERRCPNRTQE